MKRCKEFLKKETHLGDKSQYNVLLLICASHDQVILIESPAVVFQISKVGSELAAEEFINEIENDSDLTEIVDCTSCTFKTIEPVLLASF